MALSSAGARWRRRGASCGQSLGSSRRSGTRAGWRLTSKWPATPPNTFGAPSSWLQRTPSIWNDLGAALQISGDTQGAIRAYMRSVDLNGSELLPRFNLASLLVQVGKPEEAEALLKAVIAARPSSHHRLQEARAGARQRRGDGGGEGSPRQHPAGLEATGGPGDSEGAAQ